LRPSLCLHNFFQAKNAFYGTYGRSAEFHYFHISMQFILPNGTPQQAGLPPLALQRYNERSKLPKKIASFLVLMGNIEIILASGTGDAAIVDGMGGAVMIAGQTTRTVAVMEPCGRCA
jgi:hypothetical protein